jgi:hypothetical protein
MTPKNVVILPSQPWHGTKCNATEWLWLSWRGYAVGIRTHWKTSLKLRIKVPVITKINLLKHCYRPRIWVVCWSPFVNKKIHRVWFIPNEEDLRANLRNSHQQIAKLSFEHNGWISPQANLRGQSPNDIMVIGSWGFNITHVINFEMPELPESVYAPYSRIGQSWCFRNSLSISFNYASWRRIKIYIELLMMSIRCFSRNSSEISKLIEPERTVSRMKFTWKRWNLDEGAFQEQ